MKTKITIAPLVILCISTALTGGKNTAQEQAPAEGNSCKKLYWPKL